MCCEPSDSFFFFETVVDGCRLYLLRQSIGQQISFSSVTFLHRAQEDHCLLLIIIISHCLFTYLLE